MKVSTTTARSPSIATWAGLGVAAALLASSGCQEAPFEQARIENPARYWQEGGFHELVPVIRPPTHKKKAGRIQVFARLPGGKKLSVRDVDGAPVLVWPEGSEADRVESLQDPASGRWVVGDVRGTRVLPRGDEEFHVFRPEQRGYDEGPLFGYKWRRTRGGAGVAAHEELAEHLAEGHGFVGRLEGKQRERRIASLKLQGRCALCHVHKKKEGTGADDDLPFRRTDAAGWYVPLAVLHDEGPLERYRPLDVNHESPFVTLRCSNGSAPRKLERGGGVRFDCGQGGIARAHFDLAAALAAGDEHAEAVCASRRWMYEHGDDKVRAAFADAFAACGAPPSSSPPPPEGSAADPSPTLAPEEASRSAGVDDPHTP